MIGEPRYRVTCPGREDRFRTVLPMLLRRQVAWMVYQSRDECEALAAGPARMGRLRRKARTSGTR